MSKPRSAAIYARISSDTEGTGLGVARQVEDCHRLAAQLGWSIGDEYVDNDVSAYSGKRRPEYQRMMADLADGVRDGVLVYHMDRLTRRPKEFEDFASLLESAGVTDVRFVAGDVDLGTGDGLMVARMMGAVAAHESAAKGRRVARKARQNAEAGLPSGGSVRPFGYEDDKVTIREPEAVALRALVQRFIAGESLRSLAYWLDEEGVTTTLGNAWRTNSLRNLLRSARIAGLRSHHDVVVATAVWPGIITPIERDAVLAMFEQRKVGKRRALHRYLLTGLLRCSKCGGKLYSARRQTVRRYVCMSGPDHGGCGGTMIVADPLERLITDAVLYRLDTPELADALAGRTARDQRASEAAEELAKDRAQLDELASMFGAKQITQSEWLAARRPVESRIADSERSLARATGTGALRGLVGSGVALRDKWSDLNLDRQHAIVAAILDHAIILPGRKGAQALDPARVQPVWRL